MYEVSDMFRRAMLARFMLHSFDSSDRCSVIVTNSIVYRDLHVIIIIIIYYAEMQYKSIHHNNKNRKKLIKIIDYNIYNVAIFNA